jgi:Zn-dependent protease with chaperone function
MPVSGRLPHLPFVSALACLLVALLISESWGFIPIDKKLVKKGQYEADTIWRKGFALGDTALDSYLQASMEAMAEYREKDPILTLRARIFRSPEVNAFALPDGSIFVFAGLLARMNSNDELAFILAHEATHAIDGHAQKYISSGKATMAVLETLSLAATVALGASSYDGAGLINSLAQLGLGLTAAYAVNGYGRDLEREADAWGLDLMQKAGHPGCASVACFRVLLDEEDDPSRFANVFWGSHPLVEDRIATVKSALGSDCPAESAGVAEDYAPIKWQMTKLTTSLWVDAKQPKEALRTAKRYLEVFPDDPAMLSLLGDTYAFSSSPDTLALAEDAYKRAVELSQGDLRAPLLGLATLAEKRADSTSCMAYLERYLAGNARVPQRRSLTVKLNALKARFPVEQVDTTGVAPDSTASEGAAEFAPVGGDSTGLQTIPEVEEQEQEEHLQEEPGKPAPQ